MATKWQFPTPSLNIKRCHVMPSFLLRRLISQKVADFCFWGRFCCLHDDVGLNVRLKIFSQPWQNNQTYGSTVGSCWLLIIFSSVSSKINIYEYLIQRTSWRCHAKGSGNARWSGILKVRGSADICSSCSRRGRGEWGLGETSRFY